MINLFACILCFNVNYNIYYYNIYFEFCKQINIIINLKINKYNYFVGANFGVNFSESM